MRSETKKKGNNEKSYLLRSRLYICSKCICNFRVNGTSSTSNTRGDIMKTFNLMYNVGKAKYVINYHNGIKKHKDDSPFYDIDIFKNKKYFNSFIKKLLLEGYKKEGF
tara:strand:- start:186 stop:509 length:324 start_codon:yes stop_codon:yes gene_type:complete